VCDLDGYSTPLGTVPVDTALARQLIREHPVFERAPAAHVKEHSLEVQLPFLQYRLKKPFKIVPILLGTQSEETCRTIAQALKPWFTDDHLFVVSSDFSHYPDYAGARKADTETGNAIAKNSPERFLTALRKNERNSIPGLMTSCCGWSSVLTLLHLTSVDPGISVASAGYKNSGDSEYGDRNRVVGYHSFVFYRDKNPNAMNTFSLTPSEKVELLRLARASIQSRLGDRPVSPVDETRLSEALKTPCGAFVTLHKNGRLRGCIGRFEASMPLYRVVQEMALSAAFSDYRFEPVRPGELSEIDLEISVLTPLKRIRSIDEFVLGKHGIYMKKDGRSGTFLPQVAESTGWSKEEFLGHCARDKAGLGWDGWKDAELYTYEALIFDEKEFSHR
ncbi:MAG TPA: AmmeMemoRadiSam system protein A, partial [Prolixibacteraceae bacterium]|nr:AmmeMemoRadiSam system protein A [Prolixibacteraceae bacterium]